MTTQTNGFCCSNQQQWDIAQFHGSLLLHVQHVGFHHNCMHCKGCGFATALICVFFNECCWLNFFQNRSHCVVHPSFSILFFFCLSDQNMSHVLHCFSMLQWGAHAAIGHEAKTTQMNWDTMWNKHDDQWAHWRSIICFLIMSKSQSCRCVVLSFQNVKNVFFWLSTTTKLSVACCLVSLAKRRKSVVINCKKNV